MSPTPLLFVRGSVYLIKFASDDPARNPIIEKFCLCLQQGSIIHNRPFFVGVILTTCKNNSTPRLFPWTVYVAPAESRTDFGAIIECSQIYTVPKADVVKYAYNLSADTMRKVDQALQFGIGVVNVEDLKRLRPTQ